jgi:RecA/RadA recombinase
MGKWDKEKKKVDFANFGLVFDKYDMSTKTEKDIIYYKTGVLAFDMITEGKGLPQGLVSFYSKSGNGKTTLSLDIVRNLCTAKVPTLFIPVEPSEKLRADMKVTGFPIETLRVIDCLYYNEIQEVMISFFHSPYQIAVIDSLTALSMGEETFEDKPLEDAPKIGEDAGPQTRLCRYLSGKCKRTGKTVIYICQTRKDIDLKGGGKGTNMDGNKQAGSEAVFFYADLTVRMAGQEKFTAEELFGIKDSHIVASKGYLSADKNRHCLPLVKIPYFCVFGKGISNKEMIKIWMKWRGYYTVGGAWYKVDFRKTEYKLQGKAAFNTWITEKYAELVEDFYSDAPAFFKFFQDEKMYANYMASDIDDAEKVQKTKVKVLEQNKEVEALEQQLKESIVVGEQSSGLDEVIEESGIKESL